MYQKIYFEYKDTLNEYKSLKTLMISFQKLLMNKLKKLKILMSK